VAAAVPDTCGVGVRVDARPWLAPTEEPAHVVTAALGQQGERVDVMWPHHAEVPSVDGRDLGDV
jgi:hypothetical protein